MSASDFRVEELLEGSPIPLGVYTDNRLSGPARAILMAVHGRPKNIARPTKAWLMTMVGFGEGSWKKYTTELVALGWLIRTNHGGGGRGKWRHERTFLRTPRNNPLDR
jgi:hypothetical protein